MATIASERLQSLLDWLDDGAIQHITQLNNNKLERGPLVRELIWSRFHAYRALIGRMCFVAIGRVGSGRPWYRDTGCLQLLQSALGGADVDEILARSAGKFHEARARFESEFASALAPMFISP